MFVEILGASQTRYIALKAKFIVLHRATVYEQGATNAFSRGAATTKGVATTRATDSSIGFKKTCVQCDLAGLDKEGATEACTATTTRAG